MIQSRFVFYLSARLLVVLSALHAAPDKPLSGAGGGVGEMGGVREGGGVRGGEGDRSQRGEDYLGVNRCEVIN